MGDDSGQDAEIQAELRELRTAVKLLVQMLVERGQLTAQQQRIITKAALGARGERPARVYLPIADKYAVANAEMDCASYIAICRSISPTFRRTLPV